MPNEWATSEFQKPSLSKWGQVHNLSCENEFYLHELQSAISKVAASISSLNRWILITVFMWIYQLKLTRSDYLVFMI